MDAITSLNLEAFLEALFQLDEATQTELVEQLNQIVEKYPELQALHEAALDRLLENYDVQSRSKLLLTTPQKTTPDLDSSTPELSDLISQFLKRQAQLLNDPNMNVSETVSPNSLPSVSQSEEISKSEESPMQKNKIPFWERGTPSERADELLEWVAKLPETNLSLPDEAFDRSSIYK